MAYRITSQIEIEKKCRRRIGGRGARKGSRARVTMGNERGGEGFVLPLLATPPTYSRKDGRKNKGPLIIGGKPFFLPMETKLH